MDSDGRFDRQPEDSPEMESFKLQMEKAATKDALREMYASEHKEAVADIVEWFVEEEIIIPEAVAEVIDELEEE